MPILEVETNNNNISSSSAVEDSPKAEKSTDSTGRSETQDMTHAPLYMTHAPLDLTHILSALSPGRKKWEMYIWHAPIGLIYFHGEKISQPLIGPPL